MTRKEQILQLFADAEVKLSCKQVSDKLVVPDDKRQYLSGSVTTILKKLVEAGKLAYAATKTAKGGNIYQKA